MVKKKLIEFINNFELYLATLLFMLLTILLFMQVFSRYVLNSSLTWTEEVSIIFFVWMTYFSISAATLKRKHIRMDFVLVRLPFRLKKIGYIFSNLMCILFFGYFLWPFTTLVINMYNMHSKTPIVGFPRVVVYGAVAAALALSIIRFIQDSIALIHDEESALGKTTALLNLDNS